MRSWGITENKTQLHRRSAEVFLGRETGGSHSRGSSGGAQVTQVPLPVNITSGTGTVTYITLSAVNTTGKPGNLTVLQVHVTALLVRPPYVHSRPSQPLPTHLARPSCACF